MSDYLQFFGPDGPLASSAKLAEDGFQYEFRPQQTSMATAVAGTLAHGGQLLVEAGTGVGKSFAYLAPAVQHALATKKPVIVSTHTLALQDQLIRFDVPRVQAAIGEEFKVAIGRGRRNYLCERRFHMRFPHRAALPGTAGADLDLGMKLHAWVADAHDGQAKRAEGVPAAEAGPWEGIRSEIGFAVPDAVWRDVAAEPGNCLHQKCPHFTNCFFQEGRRAVRGAQVVVSNHALFFANLNLRLQGGAVLPETDAVIFDEAHTLEEVASSHLGIAIPPWRAAILLGNLWQPTRGRGLLATDADKQGQDLCGEAELARLAFNEFWTLELDNEYQKRLRKAPSKRGGEANIRFAEKLDALGSYLEARRERMESEGEVSETEARMRDVMRLADDVRVFATQADERLVYWAERARSRDAGVAGSMDGAQLRAAPLRCGDTLGDTLFASYKSVVMTSATLATPGAGPDGLDYLRHQLGCPDAEGLVLGSPFDFTRQVRGLRANVRDPRDWQGWEDDLVVLLERVARENGGRMLVLFTAYGPMRRVAERIDRAIQDLGYPLLVQGEGLSPAEMVARFKAEPSVMLGTDSFWQGIDVPGDALSTLVITRLPFAVPDHPLLEARHEDCEANGGNAFFDLSVPQAILKFKQGFGRLIRRSSDTGLFVVADPRVWNMRYGERFLAAIPEFPWERE